MINTPREKNLELIPNDMKNIHDKIVTEKEAAKQLLEHLS